jgi:hypothetical protein
VILVMPLKVCFDPRGGNREQAKEPSRFRLCGKKGSVRTIVWPLSGESFNVQECCPERCSIMHSVALPDGEKAVEALVI